MNDSVTIHTDGSCTGNPGPGGFAAIIEVSSAETVTVTGGDPATTNNRMELSAVIEAIRTVNTMPGMGECPITVRSDSKYVINAFKEDWIGRWQNNGWLTARREPVLNQDLWQDLSHQITNHRMTWRWVKGHAGDAMNERCDLMAKDEAAHAPRTDGYWTSAGNPRSVVERQPAQPSPDPPPENPSPDAAAIGMIRAMPQILATSQSFDQFRTGMLRVMAAAQREATTDHPP